MKMRLPARQLAIVALVVALAVMPQAVGNNYQIFVLTLIGLYTMLTVGLSLVMGYADRCR
jgi:ABC-type branched-subunit amino acid transport system permease subunit